MGCTLRSVLWKLFHELIFLCFYREFVLRLVWRALIQTLLHLNISYFGVIYLLCTLCVKEEDDDEVTDDYLHLVTTQIWLFDNVCCCSFRIFFFSCSGDLCLKPFFKAVLYLHAKMHKNIPTMFKLQKICNSIVILYSTGGLILWHLTETSF